jgi:hypothetical protein
MCGASSAPASRLRLEDAERGRFEPFVMYSPDEARYFDDPVAAIFGKAGMAPYVQHMSQVHAILTSVTASCCRQPR